MSHAELNALLPIICLSLGTVLLMLQIAFWRNLVWTQNLCGLFLVTTMAVILLVDVDMPKVVTPLIIADKTSELFSLLILLAALFTSLISGSYLKTQSGEKEEFFLLLLLSTLGSVVLVSATHLASLLLGLELLGVSLYAMIAYPEEKDLPLEASIKYLVLSGAASAILLFGFAFLYTATGSLHFESIGKQLLQSSIDQPGLLLAASALIFSGIAFKLSLVPFHMWTPDVYQGAPAPVTGYLASVSKTAVFVALMRWYLDTGLYQFLGLTAGISVVAVASMLVGNLLALKQNSMKRILAYSSIAHFGYLMIVLVVCARITDHDSVTEASSYYLIAYVITTLAAFTLIAQFTSEGNDNDQVSVVNGLFWRQPLLATLFTTALLSLAGIPLTAGFIGKFYLFSIAVESNYWHLLSILIVGSGIGIFYYLRIVFAMTKKPGSETENGAVLDTLPLAVKGTTLTLIILILILGIYPQPVMTYLATGM